MKNSCAVAVFYISVDALSHCVLTETSKIPDLAPENAWYENAAL